MQKLPLHPDELRIGYNPSGGRFNWTIVIVIVLVIGTYLYYRYATKKKQDETK